MEAVANQWKENLGHRRDSSTPIQPNPTTTPRSARRWTGPWSGRLGQDYPSLQDYLEPLYGSNGGYNAVRLRQPDVRRPAEAGRPGAARGEAIPIYQQADDIDAGGHAVDPVGLPRLQHRAPPTVTNVVKAGPLDTGSSLELVQVVQRQLEPASGEADVSRRYLIRRLLLVVPVLLGTILLVFGMVFLAPGDPIRRLAGNKPLLAEHVSRRSRPLPPGSAVPRAVLATTSKRLAHGDFGATFTGRDVSEIIKERFPVTLKLALGAFARRGRAGTDARRSSLR